MDIPKAIPSTHPATGSSTKSQTSSNAITSDSSTGNTAKGTGNTSTTVNPIAEKIAGSGAPPAPLNTGSPGSVLPNSTRTSLFTNDPNSSTSKPSANTSSASSSGNETSSSSSRVNLSNSTLNLQNTVITKLTADKVINGLKVDISNQVIATVKQVEIIQAQLHGKLIDATSVPPVGQNTGKNPSAENIAAYKLLLNISGKNISVSSPKFFAPNSTLKLLVINANEFLALEKPTASAQNKVTPALDKLIQGSSTQKIEAVLQQTIRAQLPKQESLLALIKLVGNQLSNTSKISTLQNSASGLTISTQSTNAAGINTPLTALINSFVNNLPSSQQLQSSNGLIQLFRNSGLFLESKLNNHISRPVNDAGTQRDLQLGQDFKANLSRTIAQLLKSGLIKSFLSAAGKPIASEKTTSGTSNQTDKTNASSSSKSGNSSTANIQNPTLSNSLDKTLASKPDLTSLHKLMTILGKSPMRNNQSEFDAINLVKRLLANLSRIQLQQVIALNSQLRGGEDRELLNQFSFEIPVRNNNDGLDWFQFNVEEKEYQQKNHTADDDENTDNNNDKEKVWNVSLSFELDSLGLVSAQVTIIDSTVSAHFLAEKSATVTTVNKYLGKLKENLQNAGVNVTQLDCRQGTLQDRKTQLQYQLVDIKT